VLSCANPLIRKFYALEAFPGKAFKGFAVLGYCKPLITRYMEASGVPAG
jgi:hypothetical protein